MFINISNHPSSKWSKEQITSAKEMGGEIIDIPFPQIPPDCQPEDFEKYVPEMFYYDEVGESTIQIRPPSVIHIMGEMTFTYFMVDKFQQQGFTIVASTTERKAIVKDGVKTSVFNFIQFREYPKIIHHRKISGCNGDFGMRSFFIPDYMDDKEANKIIKENKYWEIQNPPQYIIRSTK